MEPLFGILTVALLLTIIILNVIQMATQAEIAQELHDMKTQNEKARAEQSAAFAKLQSALEAAGNSTPEVDEAMAELKTSIQADDDMNPDDTAEA